VVNNALSNPFVVTVSDTHGNPVSGESVTFAITAGGGSISGTQPATTGL